MDINDRLYVELNPLAGPNGPRPHPIEQGQFDPSYVYKVLGMYNPSETSECYFVLANPARQIWFIPQRHLLAYGLIYSDELFLLREAADQLTHAGQQAATRQNGRNGLMPIGNPVDGGNRRPATLLNGRNGNGR